MFQKPAIRSLWIVLPILMSGCDDRATHIAREAANRQSQQNTVMAELNKSVASGTHELVAADAQARKEIIDVHHELQAERTRLDTGWDALESERQRIAGQRRTESLLGPVVTFVGWLLLVIVLLGFCWYAVGSAQASEDHDIRLNEYLVCEVLAPESPLLPANSSPLPLLGPSESHDSS